MQKIDPLESMEGRSTSSLPELPKTAASTWFDFSWPTLVFCGLSVGFLGAATSKDVDIFSRTAENLRALFTAGKTAHEPRRGKVLVFTTNPKDEFVAAATLAPSGFVALRVRSLPDALTQIQANAGSIHLAVLDATNPDYQRIAQALRGAAPPAGIVVLHASPREEVVASLILQRL